MNFREATIEDIPRMQVVRNLVKENVLSDPSYVTDQDCKEYITVRGKGWVCEVENTIIGFAIADLKDHSIWALFIQPEYEGRGIGKTLHNIMLRWYFSNSEESLWLTTAPKTRAENFYRKAGWKEVGFTKSGEVKFELTYVEWKKRLKDTNE